MDESRRTGRLQFTLKALLLLPLVAAAFLSGWVIQRREIDRVESKIDLLEQRFAAAVRTNSVATSIRTGNRVVAQTFPANSIYSSPLVNVGVRRTVETTEDGDLRYVSLPTGSLQWSANIQGKTGFFYFTCDGKWIWEFAPSPYDCIEEFDGKPLRVAFYGQSTRGSRQALDRAGSNALRVAVGEVLLVRCVRNRDKIYAVKIEQQEQREAMTMTFAELQSASQNGKSGT